MTSLVFQKFGSLQPIRTRRSRVVVSDNRLTSCDPLNSVGGVSVISSPDHFFSPQLLQQFGGDFVQSFQSVTPFSRFQTCINGGFLCARSRTLFRMEFARNE